MRILFIFLFSLAIGGVDFVDGQQMGRGAFLRVDRLLGDDANDGREGPLKSIARAVQLAQPGDTINLEPGVYYESIDLSNKHGLPGKPITINGNGAILNGSELITRLNWIEVAPGMFRAGNLYENIDEDLIARWFIVSKGRMNRMGRNAKGPSEDLVSKFYLDIDEWTYDKRENAFYVRIDPKESLHELGIRYPVRNNAVVLDGTGSWLTIKNITATHFYDDGFNVRGHQRNIVFENVGTVECGDDGFCAHEDVECVVDGFFSMGNATGICDISSGKTSYKKFIIKDCVGCDLYFKGKEHSLANGVIYSSADRAFWIEGSDSDEGAQCLLRMKNIKMYRDDNDSRELRIASSAVFHAERCQFFGLNLTVTPGGSVDFRNCLVTAGRKQQEKPEIVIYPNTVWKSSGNRFDIRSLRVDKAKFPPETFAEFHHVTQSDADSRWEG